MTNFYIFVKNLIVGKTVRVIQRNSVGLQILRPSPNPSITNNVAQVSLPRSPPSHPFQSYSDVLDERDLKQVPIVLLRSSRTGGTDEDAVRAGGREL